ncbi:MAG: right-handed parallel beta-helix repeat-containing protein [Phycisphaerales bacterium]|nr:right-handed parallel beta-helix repeat-containing protein [Phycisphaerales bacterium]
MNRNALIALVVATAGLVTSAVLVAGPLNPPGGAVASTYKTLTEVEPRIAINATNTPGDSDSLYRITQPGSYYLTGNITGVTGKLGIEIAASGVTLDLSGFTLTGSQTTLAGISYTPGSSSLGGATIRNGTVVGWGGNGIDLLGSGTAALVEDVQANSNWLNGISISSFSAVVRACRTFQNLQRGVVVSSDALVESCVFNSNGTGGLSGANGVTVRTCTFRANPGEAVSLVMGGNVADCTVEGGGHGVHLLDLGSVTGCTIAGTFGSLGGISVQNYCTVRHNTCSANDGGGIRAAAYCVITDNTCATNTGSSGTVPGITAGSNNRIEANTVSSNNRGIVVTGTGCVIVRNIACSNSINYALASGNRFGPIVVTALGGAVSGNTATSVLSTTDPWANFAY